MNSSLSRFCISVTIFFIFFNFCFVFISSMGVFPIEQEGDPSNSTSYTGVGMGLLNLITAGNPYAFVGATALSIAGLAAAASYGLVQRNWSPFAVVAFSSIFLLSFTANIGTITSMGVFSNPHVAMFMGIFYIGMMFIFGGAVLYLLKGSE